MRYGEGSLTYVSVEEDVLSREFTPEEIDSARKNAANIEAGINRPTDYTTNEIIALQHLHPGLIQQVAQLEVQDA